MSRSMPPSTQSQNRPSPLPWLALAAIGIGWGITGPLSKFVVSAGYHPVGVTFWDTLITAVVLTMIVVARGRRVPVAKRYIVFFLVCGFLGTALPNVLAYTAYKHLPVGVNVMILSLVPMATLMISLPLKLEKMDGRRLAGLALGVVAVLMIFLPKTSLPDPAKVVWVLLPVIVSISYAGENVYIAHARPRELDALAIMFGLSWGALFFIVPAVWIADAWFVFRPLERVDQAILIISFLHVGAYLGYVWLIEKAGPVFASQVGYVVTGSGVLLGMIFYAERHSLWVWGALVLIVTGLALVKPVVSDAGDHRS